MSCIAGGCSEPLLFKKRCHDIWAGAPAPSRLIWSGMAIGPQGNIPLCWIYGLFGSGQVRTREENCCFHSSLCIKMKPGSPRKWNPVPLNLAITQFALAQVHGASEGASAHSSQAGDSRARYPTEVWLAAAAAAQP